MSKLSRLCLGLFAAALTVGAAQAEVTEIKIARQFGLQYLPMVLMEKHRLIEKAAAANNIELKATWLQISAASMNESLLSGSIDISASGVGPAILLWDRTNGTIGVKSIAAVSEVPMVLTSRNPSFTSIKDITAKDRIALPAVGLGSMQALTIKMAAVQAFGNGAVTKFDANTISMTHPDGTAAMLSGRHEVNAHFTTPPYSYLQLGAPGVHKVLSSYDVLGGQATLILMNATGKFYDSNPLVMKALLAALREATNLANADRAKALDDYISVTNEKIVPEVRAAFLTDKEINYQVAPRGIQKVAEFMNLVGAIKRKPSGWQDMFFPSIHAELGS